MKVIVIHPTKEDTGYVASVVGMKNYQCIAKNEVEALVGLTSKLQEKNQSWITQPTKNTLCSKP